MTRGYHFSFKLFAFRNSSNRNRQTILFVYNGYIVYTIDVKRYLSYDFWNTGGKKIIILHFFAIIIIIYYNKTRREKATWSTGVTVVRSSKKRYDAIKTRVEWLLKSRVQQGIVEEISILAKGLDGA